ncbi:MAG: MBL fold metallo-hydrolase [Pirellulales bacterium]|nr:MBL fold metallo-hydrolase [Pirellulales bacterium]
MIQLPPVERFVSSTGVRVYRIPCEAFPGFIVYAYVLLEAGPPTIVDAGSGYGQSNDHLLAGIDEVRTRFGEPITLEDVRRIIITHGHIDHFGGLPMLLSRTEAEVRIHSLDSRVLSAYEERVIVATKALRTYLERAGVETEFQPRLMEMYGFSKKHVTSCRVNATIADGDTLDGMEFIHTPGHCPGQVCIVLGDILLSADHVLEQTTPHQAPESITAYTGLGHYLDALERVRRIGGFDLALGGHEAPIRDVYRRIDQIRDSHLRKLDKVSGLIEEHEGPATISDVSKAMYPRAKGFNVLLALEEVGAHVEYLYQHGRLAVVNLDEVESEDNPALRYEVV